MHDRRPTPPQFIRRIRDWLRSDMLVLRWVFLALYLVIVAGVSAPFWNSYEIEAIYWWLALAGLMIGCQALFIFGGGTMHLCRPIRKRRLWMPALVAAFMFVLLTGGLLLALGELAKVDGEEWVAVAWWIILVVSWFFWFAVFFLASRRWERMRTAGRITAALISGSLAELLVAVPSHMIVSRRPGCFVGLGTMMGIVAGLYVMLFAFGPGIVLLFLRPRYRREQQEGDEHAGHRRRRRTAPSGLAGMHDRPTAENDGALEVTVPRLYGSTQNDE